MDDVAIQSDRIGVVPYRGLPRRQVLLAMTVRIP